MTTAYTLYSKTAYSPVSANSNRQRIKLRTMKVTFLGTGTSTGVPQIGCACRTCSSSDPRDRRLRASVLVDVNENGPSILIDCGPDLRTQLLSAGSPPIDALLITHSHYDHVGGIDDLRPYCSDRPLPTYCRNDVEKDLRTRVPYCFAEHLYPGVPTFDIHRINPATPFFVYGTEVTPLPVMHYHLPIVGYKIGRLAYITDCKTMPYSTLEIITGIDTLIINALRHKEHISHMTLEEALAVIGKARPRVAYLTHIGHDLGLHTEVSDILPPNVSLAYDGLRITV